MDQRPSRPHHNRGGHRPRRGGGPSRGSGRGGKPLPPVLLGEPSPALQQIQASNMAQLEAKIASLVNARTPLEKKVEQLQARDPVPEERIAKTQKLIRRLKALERLARERLQGKAERKAQYEQSGRAK